MRRWPLLVAYLILVAIMVLGFVRVQMVSDEVKRVAEVEARLNERRAIELCESANELRSQLVEFHEALDLSPEARELAETTFRQQECPPVLETPQ